MGALLFVLFLAFGVYVFVKGVLPYRGLKYLIKRVNAEVPQNRTFEDIVELGTGVQIDTSELDEGESHDKGGIHGEGP
jgi:hypothetical protein